VEPEVKEEAKDA
jgi:translation initiation factor 5B